jgi:hypothetical protein
MAAGAHGREFLEVRQAYHSHSVKVEKHHDTEERTRPTTGSGCNQTVRETRKICKYGYSREYNYYSIMQ